MDESNEDDDDGGDDEEDEDEGRKSEKMSQKVRVWILINTKRSQFI